MWHGFAVDFAVDNHGNHVGSRLAAASVDHGRKVFVEAFDGIVHGGGHLFSSHPVRPKNLLGVEFELWCVLHGQIDHRDKDADGKKMGVLSGEVAGSTCHQRLD